MDIARARPVSLPPRTQASAAPFPVPPLPVPVAQAEATRGAFPGLPLGFELEFQARDPWAGLARAADLLGVAGLRLRLARCTGEGVITLRVDDPGGADLAQLGRALAADPALSLSRWVTLLGVAAP